MSILLNPNLTTIVTVSGYVSMPMICQFFCNPVNWPENVSVREWVFKQSNTVDKTGKNSTSNLPENRPNDTSDSTEIVITADVHQQSTIWSDEITELEATSMS